MGYIYLKGILLITTWEIFTWRAFSSLQHGRYLLEVHSLHYNMGDIYLKCILLITTWEIFTWRAFSSLQHTSYSLPFIPHRNLLSSQTSVQTKLPHSPLFTTYSPFLSQISINSQKQWNFKTYVSQIQSVPQHYI